MLTTAVATDGFSHRHAGGDESHSHSSFAAKNREHHHGHADHRLHGHDAPQASASGEPACLAGSTAHAHICIFGFDFSLPPADDSEPRDSDAGLVALLGDGDPLAPAVTRHAPAVELILLQLDATALSSDASSVTLDRIDRPQVFAPPLCDCARFERSGVLLI